VWIAKLTQERARDGAFHQAANDLIHRSTGIYVDDARQRALARSRD
jgi:hypothetical protein